MLFDSQDHGRCNLLHQAEGALVGIRIPGRVGEFGKGAFVQSSDPQCCRLAGKLARKIGREARGDHKSYINSAYVDVSQS